MEIKLNLDVDKVGKLCSICDTCDYDINVISGRVCVDGKSVLGVMEMCGRVVTLVPVAVNDSDYEEFFKKVEPLGAYKSEGWYS